jgi:hypothetical protein
MAGFEIIVRPVVFPSIRPAPTRSLPPADDPESGQAVLSGGSGQVIALTHSYSASASRPGGTETKRKYDVARIRPEQSDGSSRSARAGGDDDVFIDVEVLKEVELQNDSGSSTWKYTPIMESENIKIIRRDQTRIS